MSILVKDMQMPYGCGNCCFCSAPDYDHNGRVHYRCIAPIAGVCESDNTIEVLNLWGGGTSDTFPAYCPLMELPEHHGDLVDVKEIRWDDHYDSDGNLSKYKIAYSDEMPDPVIKGE